MSAPKVGDRVRVECEGVVCASFPNEVEVRMPVEERAPSVRVRPEHCTVLAPPVKVGDVVDGMNIQQLPECSIIAADDGAAWIKRAGSWHFGDQDMPHHQVVSRGDQRVLRIGGTS